MNFMRTRQKQRIIIGALCAVIIGLAIGYAVLSQTLNIQGTGGIASDFNILFTNIEEGTMNGATTINKQITDSTTATFTIDLKSPGSNGEYLITVENRGNIDAYVKSINGIEEANSTDPTDIKFSIEDIKVNDKLKAKESKVFKVKVNWSSSSTSIPDTNKNLTLTINFAQDTDTNKNLTLTINFAQDTGNSSGIDTPPSTTGEAVQILLGKHDTYNYMDGTYVKGGNGVPGSDKNTFYEIMQGAPGLDSIEVINEKFFDEDGNFKAEAFEEWAFTDGGLTDEMLESSGYDTAFEMIFEITSEEFFKPLNNNYVWFDGFLWRIMGKNADGSIRMITEENVTAIPWGEENTAFDYDNSYVNDWLNNYFYPKLEHRDLLVNQTWCSETTTSSSSSRTTCTNNFSKVQKPVGLLSLDEYNLANGSSSYLDISQDFWTLTHDGEPSAWYVWYADGTAEYGSVTYAFGVRPVTNIKSDVAIISGNGTLTDPYLIGEVSDVTGSLKDNSHVGEYVTYAGRNYRVVETSNQGTKLILDGYYDSNNGGTIEESDKMIYGTNCTLCTTINEDSFINWISNNSETDKAKLVSTTWYRGDYWGRWEATQSGDYGDYKINLESTSNSYEGSVGLIRVGEMLSGQSETILSKNHTVSNSENNTQDYWTSTPASESYAWSGSFFGSFGYDEITDIYAVRPVIMISPDVQILGGNGSFNSPYQI